MRNERANSKVDYMNEGLNQFCGKENFKGHEAALRRERLKNQG
jgi:hypothetical protein